MVLESNSVARALAAVFIGFAISLPVAAFLTPIPIAPLVLVDTGGLDPAAFGAEVVVDYGNGMAIVRAGAGRALLPAGFVVAQPHGSRTFLQVDISGHTFDTAGREPAVADGLRGDGGAYLLQFIGPARSEWVRGLERRGVVFGPAFDNYAFAVTFPPELLSSVRATPVVQWVGDYHPAYKITPDLEGATGQTHAALAGFPGTTPDALRALVEGLGGEVITTYPRPPTVEFRIEAGYLPDLARSDLVLQVLKVYPTVPMDARAALIHKYSLAWSTAKTALPESLTGRSPGPDNTLYTIDDQYEGVGVADTGFDEGNANNGALDFFDGPVPNPGGNDRIIRFTNRYGIPNQDGALCGSAHGTHVAGIVASNGYSWESYTGASVNDRAWEGSEAGTAPEAKLSIDGSQPGGCGISVDPAWWDEEYADGYTASNPTPASRAWVVTHTNSWGSSAGGYATSTVPGFIDAAIDTDNERMWTFAAGNDGPDAASVSREARAKNGLSIGASQNYRPDQFESDNPNLIAGFSGRGPADSGRIKPDLVAVGTAVVSNFASGEWTFDGGVPQPDYIMEVDEYDTASLDPGQDGIPDYRYMQGTSMAAPHAAGLYILTREYLREVVGQNDAASVWYNPPSQAAKALLINGAVRMDEDLYAYPGPDQGWGRIDVQYSLFPPAPRTNQITIGQFGTTGTCDIGTGVCTSAPTNALTTAPLTTTVYSGGVPLKVTLVWLDSAGAALARNLNLQVISPSSVQYHGNQYTGGWSTPGAALYDTVNNVEQVEVQTPEVGAWTVNVIGAAVPTTAPFAVVISADVGPQTAYRVDLSSDGPLSQSVSPGGSIVLPFAVANYGTGSDTIDLTDNIPGELNISYSPSNSFTLPSGGSADGFAVIGASPAAPVGVYVFDITGTSQGDPSGIASDFLTVTVEVLASPLPSPIRVTTLGIDELDPSVLAFDDVTVGKHLFIPYRKSTAVDPANDWRGGVNVWVAHAVLDANGQPVLPFDYKEISFLNDNPNDLRLLRIPTGLYANRIVVTWTGENPNATNPDQDSWGRAAYIDAGLSPYYQGGWSIATSPGCAPLPSCPYIEQNYGSTGYAQARVSYPLWRVAASANGELYWVWEHLDYASATAPNPTRVQTTMIRSSTGGATWPACGVYNPANVNCILVSPNDSNFYFFPNGIVDKNDVAWLFFYWRTATGNDRDLSVRLYDGAAGDATPFGEMSVVRNIYDTSDNIQWPAALAIDPPGVVTNSVYFVVTRDLCATDLKMYIAVANGTFGSATPPTAASAVSGPPCDPTAYSLSSSFTLLNPSTGPAGGLGTAVSNANYNRRPILNLVATEDVSGTDVWLPVMETATPYNEQNLWTWYTNPGFSNSAITKITADAFAKGHQMSSTLTTAGVGKVYEVWHMNRGTATTVNYDVYLTIYSKNWESASDTAGPIVTTAFTTPSPVNATVSPTFQVLAAVNDITTGNSDIAAAEYAIDAPGPGSPMTAVDGFDSPTEAVVVTLNAASYTSGAHQVCVRGQDVLSNWGSWTCFPFTVSGLSIGPQPPVVTGAVLVGGSFADVRIDWDAGNEASPGGPTDYEVLRATVIGGPYGLIGTVAAVGAPAYSHTDLGRGHGDPATYFYRVRSVNGTNTANAVDLAAKYAAPVSLGWNLLSVPLVQADYAAGTVLQSILSSVSTVRTYRQSDGSDPWKSYHAFKMGDLTAFAWGEAFWAEIVAPATQFTIAGLVANTPQFQLDPGWNFVSYGSFVPNTQGGSLAGVPGVARVEALGSTADPYSLRVVPAGEMLVPGAAYWIQVTGGGGGLWVQG